jgi:DNA-binding transcriptional LysR family regulator
MPRSVCMDTIKDTQEPSWDDYRIFIQVARAGNFYRAAMELATTQATVSRRIGVLERALGMTLFDRPRGRGVVELTFDGRRVLQEATAAELALARTRRQKPNGDGISGDCKLLGTDGIANFWMPPFLKAFSEHYPNIQLKYFLTSDYGRSQRPPYDLQMQYLKSTEADTVTHQLATMHFNFMASQDYIASYGRPKDTAALATHKVLKYSNHLSDENSWSEYAVDLATQRGAFYSNSSAFLVDLVLEGMGIAMLPTYLVAFHPRLVPLISDYHLKLGVFLNFQKDVAKKVAVRKTIDFLKDVAFDRRAMPWFRDEYEPPSPEWRALARTLLNGITGQMPTRLAG